MDRNAILPDRCVKCNERADGYRRRLTVSHSPTSVHLMFGALIASLTAKKATLEIGLCDRHRAHRSRAITPGLVALGALLGLFVIPTFATTITPAIGAALLFVLVGVFTVAGIYALVKLFAPSVQATKITDTHVWLKGVDERFLESLPLPPATADGSMPVAPGTPKTPLDPAAAAERAFTTARNGAIAFAAGCLITAGTYLAAPGGRYTIVWGLVFFGIVAFVRGLNEYRRVPAADRTSRHLATIGGIFAVGLLAGGFVFTSEVQGSQDAIDLARWNAAIARSEVPHAQAVKLFTQVASGTGAWTAQNSSDMAQIGRYYADAADILDPSPVPRAWAWYKDGLIANYRQTSSVAADFGKVGPGTTQSQFDVLLKRWVARTDDFNALQKRLDDQNRLAGK
jgi:hypothetical protein